MQESADFSIIKRLSIDSLIKLPFLILPIGYKENLLHDQTYNIVSSMEHIAVSESLTYPHIIAITCGLGHK